jgi:SAM-dependent methyltransferase
MDPVPRSDLPAKAGTDLAHSDRKEVDSIRQIEHKRASVSSAQRLLSLLSRPAPHPTRFTEPVRLPTTGNDNAMLRSFLASLGSDAVVLDLGSGSRKLTSTIVACDIVPYAEVDVVGDAHNLPFSANSFDAAVLQSVIEHVPEPERVLSECARVLNANGLLYVEAPFLYPVHAEEDYYRWTLKGLRYAIGKHLMVIDSGVAMASATALSLAWRGYVDQIVGRRSWLVANGIAWATSWVKYLDRSRAHSLPGTVYAHSFVLAQKRPNASPET